MQPCDILARRIEQFCDILNRVDLEYHIQRPTYLRYIALQSLILEDMHYVALENFIVEDLADLPQFYYTKTPDLNSLPSELYMYGVTKINNCLYEVILQIWKCVK